ncbi:FMN-linked oxidoreductase [Aspergillus cavernicola]|uniref:FMN-linked oxidoreductase n=1 Tax=Aspergillus cavernicola TaxID=176166 RepID=A0ABR4IL64_9EURO
MGEFSENQYTDFRSVAVDGLLFFTPKQRVPVGTAILNPAEGVTEETITPAFRPITIRGKTFQNRVWVAPMCMYSCQDGMFSNFHVAHYGQWAMRGSALITIEVAAMALRGRNNPQDAGLLSDNRIAPLKQVVDLIYSQSQKATIQLQHAGRKCGFGSYAEDVQGSTAEPWNKDYATPGEMTEEDIWETIDAYGEAARRAVVAGINVIAIHDAHGYLVHSFASPAINTLRYIPILSAEGVDLFDISSGGTDRRQKVQLGQQYQVPFAKAVKDLGLPNVFGDGVTVHDILSNNKADVVQVAREFLRDPNIVQKVALSTGTNVTWVDQYHRAPMNGKYVESTTSIMTGAKASDFVMQSHENQAPNKIIS